VFINIEDWLQENSYNLEDIGAGTWFEIRNYAEQSAQDIIDNEMDTIGQEIVTRFRLKLK